MISRFNSDSCSDASPCRLPMWPFLRTSRGLTLVSAIAVACAPDGGKDNFNDSRCGLQLHALGCDRAEHALAGASPAVLVDAQCDPVAACLLEMLACAQGRLRPRGPDLDAVP